MTSSLGYPLSEEYQAMGILMALPPEWSLIHSIILNKTGVDSVDGEARSTVCLILTFPVLKPGQSRNRKNKADLRYLALLAANSLNLRYAEQKNEPLPRIQYRPIHSYEGRSSQIVRAHSCGSLWRPRQLPARDLRYSNLNQLRDGEISCRILEEELISIQNCTRYIRDPAITINICLLSINIQLWTLKDL